MHDSKTRLAYDLWGQEEFFTKTTWQGLLMSASLGLVVSFITGFITIFIFQHFQ